MSVRTARHTYVQCSHNAMVLWLVDGVAFQTFADQARSGRCLATVVVALPTECSPYLLSGSAFCHQHVKACARPQSASFRRRLKPVLFMKILLSCEVSHIATDLVTILDHSQSERRVSRIRVGRWLNPGQWYMAILLAHWYLTNHRDARQRQSGIWDLGTSAFWCISCVVCWLLMCTGTRWTSFR